MFSRKALSDPTLSLATAIGTATKKSETAESMLLVKYLDWVRELLWV